MTLSSRSDSSVPQALVRASPVLAPYLHTIIAFTGRVEQFKPPSDYESGVLSLYYASGKTHGGLIGSEVLVVLRQPRIRV